MVLPNATVLISFFLTEGNKKILIHKEKYRFPFSATAHRDFEIFKKAVLGSSNGTFQIIAGSGEEEKNDGTQDSFSQPMGICMENGKNILNTNAQVGEVIKVNNRCRM